MRAAASEGPAVLGREYSLLRWSAAPDGGRLHEVSRRVEGHQRAGIGRKQLAHGVLNHAEHLRGGLAGLQELSELGELRDLFGVMFRAPDRRDEAIVGLDELRGPLRHLHFELFLMIPKLMILPLDLGEHPVEVLDERPYLVAAP